MKLCLAPALLAGSVLSTTSASVQNAPPVAGDSTPNVKDTVPLAIDHVLIVTTKFDELTAWYIDVLGFAFEDRWTAPDVVPGLQLSYLIHPGGARLEIAGNATATRPDRPAVQLTEDFAYAGFRHVCFAMPDIDAAFNRAKAAGAKVLAEPFDYPRLGRRLAFLQDPDGNVVEFTAPLGEAAAVSPAEAIRGQLERWRVMFSLTGQGKPFALAGYEDMFDTRGDNLLVFDSYVPVWASTQIVGFDDYRTVWERDVNESFPGWTITRMDVVRIDVAKSGDLAWSAINFWGEGRQPDGTTYQGSQHGTHVWRLIDGDWRVVHEHLTAPITVRGEANATIDSEADYRPRGNQ